ncbi:glycosyltransferase family 25 protein [Brucella anthropi]|uniref:glycosyltransferase family 25 protein n=1 Tax=Brucella anthropi TaxID=529 RepID=UPI002671BC84|nr:glycosyltransferase family 25 protein [Brucella anthropi]WKT93334.1 glycosyltransferase family 25 protein [Brucella anthropi]
MDHSVPVYVINLARSRDRWDRLKSNADALSIELRRVEAVEGKLLSPEELTDFDDGAFRRWHGKVALPAEIGCYFSHIRALEMVADGAEPFAVIVEDDIVLPSTFNASVNQLTHVLGWDVIKLVNHRLSAFRPFLQVNDEITVGRSLHGPMGSAAAYLVTRQAARKLSKSIRTMRLPYDVELERGWAAGHQIFTTNVPLVSFSATESTIAQGRSAYAKARLPIYKRISTLLFRATDYVRRIAYALNKKRLKEAEG